MFWLLPALGGAIAGTAAAATGVTAAKSGAILWSTLAGAAAAQASYEALPSDTQAWIREKSKDFANSDVGAIILTALTTSSFGAVTAAWGPQFASASFAIPGLFRGEDFHVAWTKETAHRIVKTILYFAAEYGKELGDKLDSSIEEILAKSGIEEAAGKAWDDAYNKLDAETKSYVDKALAEVGPALQAQWDRGLAYVTSSTGIDQYTGLTAVQLAEKAGIREDIAASVIALWNEQNVDLSQYDLATGLSPESLAKQALRDQMIINLNFTRKSVLEAEEARRVMAASIPMTRTQVLRDAGLLQDTPVVKAPPPAAPKPLPYTLLLGVSSVVAVATAGVAAYRMKR